MVLNYLKSVFNVPEWAKNLPDEYQYLKRQSLPRILQEALKEYGVKEVSGDANNPIILRWASEIGGWVFQYYKADSIPWCGLFVGVCAKRAGYPHGQSLLSSKDWLKWGDKVERAGLGDVLVFIRAGGGHVGFYVGEDKEAYYVYGGNQSDMVGFTRIAKTRLAGIRRQKNWVGGKQVFLAKSGNLSYNEV